MLLNRNARLGPTGRFAAVADGRPPPITRSVVSLLTGHYKEVVSRVSSEQSAEFDHVLIDVNQVRSACVRA